MNAILCDLPDYVIEKLQKVQNHAARVLCGLRKYDKKRPADTTLASHSTMNWM